MPELLAAASILVAVAGGVSLLLALPATGIAETAGETDAASRARTWLAALIVPPVTGIIAAAWALGLHAQGLMASPHLGGQRPHLCLLPLLNAPAGVYRLRAFSWFALALVTLAALRLIFGALSSHLLRRLTLASGATFDDNGRTWATRPARGEPGAPPPPGAMPPAEGPPEERSDEAGPWPVLPGANDEVLVVDLGGATSFCAGLLRPVVVVSSGLIGSLGAQLVRAIVAHELAHVRRRDNLVGLIADACTALLVFLPTVHYYRQQWRAAAEAAADDQALASGVSPEVLFEALQAVQQAQQRRRPDRPSLIALLIPPPATTDQRARRLASRAKAGVGAAAEVGLRRALSWVAVLVGVGAVAFLTLASEQSVQDSLYCAAEQFVRAAR